MESCLYIVVNAFAHYWIFCERSASRSPTRAVSTRHPLQRGCPCAYARLIDTEVRHVARSLTRSHWHRTSWMPFGSESPCDFRTRGHACVRACLLRASAQRYTSIVFGNQEGRYRCVLAAVSRWRVVYTQRLCIHARTHIDARSRAIYAAKSIRHEWNHDFHAWRKSRRLEWRDEARRGTARRGTTSRDSDDSREFFTLLMRLIENSPRDTRRDN